MNQNKSKKCGVCYNQNTALQWEQIQPLMTALPTWDLLTEPYFALEKTYPVKNFMRAMLLAQAVAWLAEKIGHHPDLTIQYSQVRIRWNTHSVKGLTEIDFQAAQKCDALLSETPSF